LAGAACGCSAPRIGLVRGAEGSGRDAFEVRGLDGAALERATSQATDWSSVFTVRVAAAAAGHPPMLGKANVEGGVLRFEPAFALEPGLEYRATLRSGPWLRSGAADGAPLEASFTLPARSLEPKTSVRHVYPTASVLPENQLKFYVHFSGPMRRGQAYDRIRLVDSSGREVDSPFLELGEELWDRSGTRFTLFIDPGRIKRGVKPHEELGPALEAGNHYTLDISADWLDADGARLTEPFRKTFAVAKPDYEQPDPPRWKITAPPAGTSEPLRVSLGEPLDHALLLRLLSIEGPDKMACHGESETGSEEREWIFTPDQPWRQGAHALVIDTMLEDLAGNSVDRPFEVDASRGIESRIETHSVKLPFDVNAR
jgi:hypothetical protein